MTATEEQGEREVRDLIECQAAAIRGKDIDGATAGIGADVVIFDALPPLQRNGFADSRARTVEWFGSYDGPIGYEIRDLAITVGADVAFARYLYHVTGTLTGGNQVDMSVRMTICLERVEGEWTITHEHTSVPFDAESGKAALTLTP